MYRRLAFVAALLASAQACGGPGEPPTTVAAPDTADQVLYGVVHHVTIDGVQRITLHADTVYFFEGSQVAEMLGVRVQFFSPSGELSSTVTSREGTYRWRTGEMEARIDVVGESPDGRRLTTSILQYNRSAHRISGPRSFVFDSPTEHLEGDSFTSDPDLRNMSGSNLRRGRTTSARVSG